MSTTDPNRITTEWDDLQVKFGNYTPLPKEETEEEKTKKRIEETEEKLLEKRLERLKKQYSTTRFGTIIELTADNFVDQVTNYSKNAPVVVFLYDDTQKSFQLLKSVYESLARKHPKTKFTIGEAKSIVSSTTSTSGMTASAPSAILVYKDGRCVAQTVTSQITGLLGPHISDSSVVTRVSNNIFTFINNAGASLTNSDSSDSSSEEDRSDEENERLKSKAYTSNLITQALNKKYNFDHDED